MVKGAARAAVTCIVVGVLLVGCGDGDEDAASSPQQPDESVEPTEPTAPDLPSLESTEDCPAGDVVGMALAGPTQLESAGDVPIGEGFECRYTSTATPSGRMLVSVYPPEAGEYEEYLEVVIGDGSEVIEPPGWQRGVVAVTAIPPMGEAAGFSLVNAVFERGDDVVHVISQDVQDVTVIAELFGAKG